MGGFGDSILDSEGDGSSGTDSDSETFTPETHGRTFAEPGGPTSGPGGYTTPGGTTGTDEGSCVIEGTLIQTQRGSIPVEWVELGDKVYSYDFDSCKFGYFEVLEILLPVKKASWFKITTALGYTLSCTADHPIFSTSIESGELPVSEAEIGDPVYVFQDGEIVKDFLVSKEKIIEETIVYNFEIDIVHSYFSDGILSHNAGTKGRTAEETMESATDAASASSKSTWLGEVADTTSTFVSAGRVMGGYYAMDAADGSELSTTIPTEVDGWSGSSYYINSDVGPCITDMKIDLVGTDADSGRSNYLMTLECTAWIREIDLYNIGVSTVVGQLCKSSGGTTADYFSSVDPSSADVIFSTMSTGGPGQEFVDEIEETDYSVVEVCSDWPSDPGIVFGDNISLDSSHRLSLEYNQRDTATNVLLEASALLERSGDSTPTLINSLMEFNIDPALIGTLQSPIETWEQYYAGTLSPSGLYTVEGHEYRTQYRLLYEYQDSLTEVSSPVAAGIRSTSLNLAYTPMKFYFVGSMSDTQFEDFASDDLFLRLTYVASPMGTFTEADLTSDLKQGATSVSLDIQAAARGYFARDFETVNISVDSANAERPYDIIELVNPNPFYVNCTVEEISYLPSYERTAQTVKMEPLSTTSIHSLNNYQLTDTRFYRCAATSTLDTEIQVYDAAEFNSWTRSVCIARADVSIDSNGDTWFINLPSSCTKIKWVAFEKGKEGATGIEKSVPSQNTIYKGTISVTTEEQISSSFTRRLDIGYGNGATYTVEFIFQDSDGTMLGYWDAAYTTARTFMDAPVQPISFAVVYDADESTGSVSITIAEAISSNLTSEYMTAATFGSSGGAWQSEVESIKNNAGMVTTYTITRQDCITGEEEVLSSNAIAGATTSYSINSGGESSRKVKFKVALKVASLAAASEQTAVTTKETRSGVGDVQFAYLAQELNWPQLFYGAANPGQVYGLTDYFEQLYTQKEVYFTIDPRGELSTPYVISVDVERSLIAQANIVTVTVGGTLDEIDHIILYLDHNGVVAPYKVGSPLNSKVVFVDKDHYDSIGYLYYRASIFFGTDKTYTPASDSPAGQIFRYSDIDLNTASDGIWGSTDTIESLEGTG